MNAILLVLAAFVAADQPAPAPTALPEALQTLNGVTGDEKKLVDAMREIDVAHVASGKRAEELAQEEQMAGDIEKAKKRLQEAKDEYALVRQGWEFVLSKYNNNAKAQTYYGELLYDQIGDEDGALKAWHLASSLDPKLALPLNDLGIHYNHVGEYERAMQCYDKAMELEPDNPDFMFNLVQTYLTNFDFIEKYRSWAKPRIYKEAMKLSKKAAELDPSDYDLQQDYAVNFYAAERFGVTADWKEAAKAWEKARRVARKENERFYTWLNEGRVWIRKGNKAKAKNCLEESLKIIPLDKVARKLLDEVEGKAPAEEKGDVAAPPAPPQGSAAPQAPALTTSVPANPDKQDAAKGTKRNFNK